MMNLGCLFFEEHNIFVEPGYARLLLGSLKVIVLLEFYFFFSDGKTVFVRAGMEIQNNLVLIT